MNTPLEIEPHTPRVGRKNRPAPVLVIPFTNRVRAALKSPRVRPPQHQKTRRQLETLLENGAGPEKTTVLVAILAKEILAEEHPFQAFVGAIDMFRRFPFWEKVFFLYCILRCTQTLLAKLPAGPSADAIRKVQTEAADLDHDMGD
jgi:hypothetical protein